MGGPGAPKKSGKEQSERYVQQRFSREFEHTLQGIESSEDGFLNYRNTGELLVLMGFISGNPVHQAQERILLANLWKGVGGEENEAGLTRENLCVALLAILGVATGPPLEMPAEEGGLGMFAENGDFVPDMRRMQKNFNLFYLNRL